MICSSALNSLSVGRGDRRWEQICSRVSKDLIHGEQILLSLIGRTKPQFVSSPRPLGSLQLTTGQKFWKLRGNKYTGLQVSEENVPTHPQGRQTWEGEPVEAARAAAWWLATLTVRLAIMALGSSVQRKGERFQNITTKRGDFYRKRLNASTPFHALWNGCIMKYRCLIFQEQRDH